MYRVRSRERLPSVLIFNVLDGASTFDGTNSETSRIREAANDSCLPLERTGDSLVDCRWVGQVDHVDVALCCRNDKQLIFDIHAVDTLLTLQSTDGFGALQIPELDCLVPGAGRDVVLSTGLEPTYTLDGVLMGFGLLCGNGTAGWGVAEIDNIEHAC